MKPDLIITKHHYSPSISSKLHNIPFLTYYTDGGEYLIPERNPQSIHANEALSENYLEACQFFKIYPKKKPVNDYIRSPFLNIIRGVPLASSLSQEEIEGLDFSCTFGGLLTYDGPVKNSGIPFSPPWIYVTFGTISQDKDRIRLVIEALKDFKIPVLISTVLLDPKEFEAPPHIYLTRYISNKSALNHAKLVIHHGGHGTFLTSFESGVPQIVIPENTISSAQEVHARTLENLGCGLHFPKESLTAKSLREAVFHIFNQPKYQQTSIKYQQNIINQDHLFNIKLLEKLLELK